MAEGLLAGGEHDMTEPLPRPWLPSSGEVASIAFDAALRVTSASAGCERLFELPASELLGRGAGQLFQSLPDPAFEGHEGTVEFRTQRGSRAPGHVRAFYRRIDGALEVLLVDLERVARTPLAEQAGMARLASLVAHDVRNPLSSIKMVVQSMTKALDGDTRHAKRLAIAAREVRGMERLLLDFDELARGSPLRPEPSDASELIREAVRRAELELGERPVSVRIDCPERLDPVPLDRERMLLALANLLLEAARSVREGEIWVAAQREPAGVGVSMGASTADGPTTLSSSGLALALVEKVLRAHGAQFAVEDLPQGRRYRLLLPG